MSTLVAHQGGWDEILFVMLPIALFAGLLVLANRRAAQGLHDDQAPGPDGPAPSERSPGRPAD